MKAHFMRMLAVVLVAFLCATSWGATYYVATNGSDSYNGSSGSPWATLQHAVGAISAGDTILVRSGTYAGCRITNSGTASLPKTLAVETAGTVKLNNKSSSATHNGILEIEDADYWVIDGFEVDGVSKTYRCIDVRVTDHITISNNKVHDAYATGIFFGFSDNLLAEGNESYSNGEHGLYSSNSADYGTLRGNSVHNNTGCGLQCNADESMGGDGVMSYYVIDKNVSYANPGGAGINCDGLCDSRISNNLLYANTGSGITLFAIDGAEGSSRDLVYNNTVLMPSGGRWAIVIPPGGNPNPVGNKIKNNILLHAGSNGAISLYSSSISGFESDYNAVIDRFSVDDGDTTITLSTWRGYGYGAHSFVSTLSALFVDPGANDYHLKSGSPAVDAGVTLTEVTDDLDGVSRPAGSAYDIGCYEGEGGAPALNITTTSLASGQVSAAYSSTVYATGGVTPYSWSVVSGSLPAGLSLGSSSGTISGTPTTSGTSNFTIRVTDSDSPASTDDQGLSITINPSSGLLPHPRIWLNSSILSRLQAARNANSAEWLALKSWCDSRLGQNLPEYYQYLNWYETLMNYGMAFQVSGDPAYGNEGVKYLKALLRDRYAIGDGLGGTNAISIDSGYVARSMGTGVAVGRDWLNGAPDLTTTIINECSARLGEWIPWVLANGYARNDPTDNYYAGYFAMIYTASIGLEGDSGYQSSWQTNAESMWTAVRDFMMTGAGAGGNWLQGWNYGPWSAREYIGYPFALETGTTRNNHWSETTWATDLVMDQIHMLYPSRKFLEDAGCWSGNYKGDPRRAVCQMCTVMSPNSATTKGLAKWFTNHLEWEPGGSMLLWEALLYTDSSVVEVAPTIANMGGLSYEVYGHGVARSSDWNDLNGTFVGVESEPIDHQGESGLHTGEVKIGSRGHVLLVDGRTYEYTSDLANVPDITGSHLYAPLQEWWHDAVTFDMDNVNDAYAYFKTTGIESCYDGQNGESPDVSYFRRDVAFLRPDFVAVFDNITTASTSNHITEKWYMMGQPSINGATASITLGGAKLFTNTVNPTVTVSSAANAGSRTPGYSNEPASGIYKLLVSPSTASVSNNILQLFETADSTQGSMTAYDKLTPTGFMGVSIKHATNPKVVLFATAQNPSATNCSFTFTPVASLTKVLVIGMQASTNFSVNVTGTTPKTVTITTGSGYTSTANGALSFNVTTGAQPLTITTTTLPGGVVGTGYSQTMQAIGGTAPYTWSVVSGSLPSGLSLGSSSGTISGTPTATGTSNFTVRVTDNVSATDDQALSITVTASIPDLQITTSSLPGGTVGTGYSQTVSATGGVTPYSWSIASGSLPSGLSLGSSSGTISGTPTASGTSNFTVRVTDSQGTPDTDDQALSITVAAGIQDLVITTSSLPGGTEGVAYSQTVAATGGVTPYSWSIVSGSLPAGLSLGSSSGTISGTPTATGTSNFTVRVTDSQGTPDTDDQALSITVGTLSQGATYQQASSDGESTTTSTTYQTKVTLQWTPPDADTWIVFGFAEYGADSLSYNTSVHMTIDGVEEANSAMMVNSTTEYFSFATAKVATLSAASHTINIEYKSSDAALTSRIRRARIVAIRKADLELYSAASDAEVGTTSTYANYASVTFTPSTAGDYLLVWTAESMGQWSNLTLMQSKLNSTVVDEGGVASRADVNYDSYASFAVATLPASQQTVALAAMKDGLGIHNIRRCRVAAIRLSGSVFADYAAIASDTESTTTSTTFVEKTSKTWTSGATGEWLILGSGRMVLSSTSNEVEAQIQYNNTSTLATARRRPQATNEWKNFSCVAMQTVDEGGRQADADFRALSSSYTAKMKYAHMIMLPIDTGAAPPEDLVITTASVADGQIGVAYSDTVVATGGVTPYSWSIVSGSLPSGLSLGSSSGTISGTPTASGTSNFTVRVTDSQGTPDTDDQALSIYVPANLVVTTSSLPAGQIGVSYNQAVSATGGTTPYSWSVVSGSLPSGLSLGSSTGTISGTPTASGTSNFTVRVTDSQSPADTDDQALSIYVPANLVVTTSSLPAGQIGVSYNQTVSATGGTAPYAWSVISGSLPAGLSLGSSSGTISGTPTTSGTSNFTVRVTDSQSPSDTDDQALSIYIPANLVVTTSSLPNGTVSVAYSQTVVATGGTTPYSWSVVSGSLPAGLSLGSSSGTISGTPTASGTSNFTVRVTDSQSPADTDDQALSITISAAIPDLVITTSSLAGGTVNVAYSQTVQATGGVTPYSWSIVSGSLPAGLSLGSSSGTISGTPTASGTSNFTVRVTDSQGTPDTDDQALSITVAAGIQDLVITTSSLPGGTEGVAYSQTVQATGGVTPYSWSIVSGSLPAGLSLGSSSGTISGTPTATGTSNFTVRVTDSQGTPDTDDQALSITISAASQGATYQQVSSDGESTTTSTTYQTKATLQWTPTEADTWIIFGFAEYGADSLSYNTSVHMTIDGVEEANNTMMVNSTTEYFSFATAKVATLSAASHTINIEYKSSDAALTSRIRRARIVAIKKADLELYSAASDAEVGTTSTYANYASVTFTPSTAGDYLLVWTAESMGQWSNLTLWQSKLNSSVLDDGAIASRADVNYDSYASFAVATLPASQQTVALAAMKDGLGIHNIRRCRVAAIRLSGSVFADYAAIASDSEANTTSTTFVEKTSKTWTSGSVGNWLILGSGRMVLSSTSNEVEAQIQYNNTSTLATARRKPQATNEWKPFGCVAVQNVEAGGRQADADYRTLSGSYTAKMKNAHMVMLPLDSGAAPPEDLVITTSSLPNGQIGVSYSQTAQATGGVTPYSWSVVSGSLPSGLSLGSSSGTISGTPTTSGTSNFTIRVTDSQGTPDTDDQALSIYVPANLVVTTSSLPNGQTGVSYSQTVVATGGVTPYSWSIVSGSLPAGLSLGSSSGTISGTPTVSGTSNFTVRVTDSQSPADTDDQALSITISASIPDLVITTSSLAGGTVGTAYSQTVVATGGVTPYSWSIVSGSLPSGLSLGSSSGTISGTPTASGTSNFTVRVTDSQGTPDTDDQALSIIVTGGGANSTYEFSASDTESTTTSTSYQNKVSLVFTPSTADTWMIFGFAEYKGSSTSYSTLVRLTVDGTAQADLTVEPNDATDYQTFMTMKVASLSAAQHTINIDYRSENSGATARVRNVRIVAIPKGALEMVSNASDGTSTLTTTLTDYVTLNWTPATAGDYLLIWSGEASANTGYSSQVQAKINGANWDEMFIESKDNSDFYSFMSFAMTSCGTSQQTLAVAAAKESTSTATTHQIRRARVAAIRLTGSRFVDLADAASDAEATTTSTSFQEKLSKSWDWGNAGNWLILTSCRLAGTSASYSNEGRVQLDDSTVLAQPLREPNDTTDYMQGGCIDVRSLGTGTRRLDMDYRSENSGATAKIRTARLFALPLD